MTKFKKGDLIECDSTSIARVGVGEKFIVVEIRPQLSAPSFHPELVYIEVDGVIRNYSPKHFKLVEQEETMSRTEIKDKGSGSKKSEWFGYKYRVTPETSKLLQEAVFKDGGGWSGKQDFKSRCTHIFITADGYMTYLDDGDDEYFEEESDLPEKDPPQVKTKKEFKEGYWYKCVESTCANALTKGKYYQCKSISKTIDRISIIIDNGELDDWPWSRFDLNSESTFNPMVSVDLQNENTTSVTVVKARPVKDNPHFYLGEFNAETNNLFNQQEETNMSNASNRRIVTVRVFDLDPALDVEHSLVHVFKDVVTEDTNDVTLTELLHTGKLVEPLAEHNKIRTAQDNKDILARTGKKVKLEPVKVKNLSFKYV